MKQEEKKVAAFTGHRKQRLMQENKDYRNFSGQIRGKVITMIKNLYEEGFREFYSGMAEGFDMIAAEAVLQLKEQYEDMTLAAAIPFRAQAEWFDPQDQLLYRELLKKADRVVMLSEKYYRGCYLRRDTYMVSRASQRVQRRYIPYREKGRGNWTGSHQSVYWRSDNGHNCIAKQS